MQPSENRPATRRDDERRAETRYATRMARELRQTFDVATILLIALAVAALIYIGGASRSEPVKEESPTRSAAPSAKAVPTAVKRSPPLRFWTSPAPDARTGNVALAGGGPTPVTSETSRSDLRQSYTGSSYVGSVLEAGTATYCAPTPRYCHRWGGSAKLGAVESFVWGDRPYLATVCLASDRGRCVTVLVVSHCDCGSTLIDLSPYAFRRLAPLYLGRINVVVETGRPSATVPPTDTK